MQVLVSVFAQFERVCADVERELPAHITQHADVVTVHVDLRIDSGPYVQTQAAGRMFFLWRW